MKPIEFKEQNKILGKPDSMTDEECGSLPVFSDRNQCISCWELTDEEIEKIKETKCVWIGVMSGHTQPPIFLAVDTPFIERKNNGKWKIYVIEVECEKYWVIAQDEDQAVNCLMEFDEVKDLEFSSIVEATEDEIKNTQIQYVDDMKMPTLIEYYMNYDGDSAQVICSTLWAE